MGIQLQQKIMLLKQFIKILLNLCLEIKKCSIGGEVILNKLVSGNVTAQPDLCSKINNWTDPNSAIIATAFENHFKAKKLEKPSFT